MANVVLRLEVAGKTVERRVFKRSERHVRPFQRMPWSA
jgi:hypothetical protein